MSGAYHHISVLLDETIDSLQIRPSGTIVDATFGGGGHSAAILERLGKGGRLIGMDHDAAAWANALDDDRFTMVKANFLYIGHYLDYLGIKKVDGIMADLGVSSHHFDTAERGFSTRYDGPLDMRMDTRNSITAEHVLNEYTTQQLHYIFEQYGQVRNTKTLVGVIDDARKQGRIRTINSFKQVIAKCIMGLEPKYLAQVFQALRIEVNGELRVLERFLEESVDYLYKGGRLCIITFHSLEDRIVKRFMKNGGHKEVSLDTFGRKVQEPRLKVIADITPTKDEEKHNSRSRSARLRVAERL